MNDTAPESPEQWKARLEAEWAASVADLNEQIRIERAKAAHLAAAQARILRAAAGAA